MPAENEPAERSGNLKLLYEQLCNSYHKVDDFRSKLLGFLPLASGAGIFGILSPGNQEGIAKFLPQIGVFGACVTAGLLIFELKGIDKCTAYIFEGAKIEEELMGAGQPVNGKFQALKSDKWLNFFISEPVASAFIYSTVFTSWLFVASVTGFCCIILPFTATFFFSYFTWIRIVRHYRNRCKSEKRAGNSSDPEAQQI